jgi:hypothetical protein
MRILTTFDNSQTVNDRSRQARESNAKPTTPEAQDSAAIVESKPERLSRNQILSRLEANKTKATNQSSRPEPVVLARASWDDSDEDEQDVKVELTKKTRPQVEKKEITEEVDATVKAEEVASDVGKNDPSDPHTRGKLQTLLSSGGFNFSEKEREALSQILK